MKEGKNELNYYTVYYYSPDIQGKKSFRDPNLYSSKEEAQKHIREDAYSWIKCSSYSRSDLLLMIFETLCEHSECYTCSYLGKCYLENNKFQELSEQEQLEVCASFARQYCDLSYGEEHD